MAGHQDLDDIASRPPIRTARADGALEQLRRLLGPSPDGVERALELSRTAATALPINGRHLAAGVAALDVPDDPLAAVWHLGDFLREFDGIGVDPHLSQQGRHAREQIEVVTDRQLTPALDALDEQIEEPFGILAPWGETIRAGHGYLGAGPAISAEHCRVLRRLGRSSPRAEQWLQRNGLPARTSSTRGVVMTNQHPATVADSLSVHGDIHDGEFDVIVDHWAKLDARLRSFDAGTVSMQLFVKERDSKGQRVTLDVKINGHHPLVATSSSLDFVHAINEVRDEMIRQITDLKTKTEPRKNKHLRDSLS